MNDKLELLDLNFKSFFACWFNGKFKKYEDNSDIFIL